MAPFLVSLLHKPSQRLFIIFGVERFLCRGFWQFLKQRLPAQILLGRVLGLVKRASTPVSGQKVSDSGGRPQSPLGECGEPALPPSPEEIPSGPQEACPVDTVGEGGQAPQSLPDLTAGLVCAIGERQILRARKECTLELNCGKTIAD